MSLPDSLQPALQRVVHRAPFLAHLAFALRWHFDSSIHTACTNGAEVLINPNYFGDLPPAQQAGLIAHEALHCALRHIGRAQRYVATPADQARWNVAADIVVNGACARAGLELPVGGIRDRAREHMSVEDIYRALKENTRRHKMGRDLGARLRDLDVEGGVLGECSSRDEIDWAKIIRRADMLARRFGGRDVGSDSLGIGRELQEALGEAQVDWRSVLWHLLSETPNDWMGWDRRQIWRGGYFPRLEGCSLRAVVGIDTSGSVGQQLLLYFLSELSGISQVVDKLEIDLYWTDTRLHGPVRVNAATDIALLVPRGGGGTDLGPLFRRAEKTAAEEGLARLPVIYLTDGLGPTLPKEPIGLETLWVIPRHGSHEKPWGSVIAIEVPS
jgi:predicted metal-dependent peptidase